jgi:hypothetical protein
MNVGDAAAYEMKGLTVLPATISLHLGKHRCCAMMRGGTVSMPSSEHGITTVPTYSNHGELVAIVNAFWYRVGRA